MSALLEVNNLQAGYGNSHVLFDVSFSIASGGASTLLGRNGMGKTTTVRTVLGLMPALCGSVRFCGERVDGWSADRIARMGMALVPEGRMIFPTLSVRENLIAFASNRNHSNAPWTLEVSMQYSPDCKSGTDIWAINCLGVSSKCWLSAAH